MKRGATPTYTFKMPVAAGDVASCCVVFAQNSFIVKEFDTMSCVLSGYNLSVTFKQDETLEFTSGADNIDIEIQILTASGVCYRSVVITETCYDTLKPEVLT